MARIAAMQDEADRLQRQIYKLNIFGDEEAKREKAEFTRKCTHPECKGWLSTAWKCSLCTNYSCPNCFVVVGQVRAGSPESTHTCNEDDISTASMIRKSTKPCPKCGEGIEKKDGCDMMFCTSCTTPFEWSTGKIVTHGRIHNPHYYEWLGRTGTAVREHGDIPCGGIPGPRYLVIFINQCYKDIAGFHHIVEHVHEDEMHTLNRTLQDREFVQEMMVSYLTNTADKKTTQDKLRNYEIKRERARAFYDVFQTFVTIGSEYMRAISDYALSYYQRASHRISSIEEHPPIQDAVNNMLLLIDFVNSASAEIASSFGVMAPNIHRDPEAANRWIVKRVKVKGTAAAAAAK